VAGVMLRFALFEKDSVLSQLSIAMRQLEVLEDNTCCVICQNAPRCTLLLPCAHMCLCSDCDGLSTLVYCPICRSGIVSRMRVFLSSDPRYIWPHGPKYNNEGLSPRCRLHSFTSFFDS
jgi:hypothetical protein